MPDYRGIDNGIWDAVLRFKAARDGLDEDGRHGFLIARIDTNPEEDFDDCVARMKAYNPGRSAVYHFHHWGRCLCRLSQPRPDPPLL